MGSFPRGTQASETPQDAWALARRACGREGVGDQVAADLAGGGGEVRGRYRGAAGASTYNEAGLLDKVEARVRGAAAWTPFVDNIDYDAKGQREKIVYAGGATTTDYRYDEQTFRLIELVTTRASDNKKLQDLSYTYDPVGNITEIQDAAQQEVFFDGDVVLPKMAYVYDALYRPRSATGREHASTGAPAAPIVIEGVEAIKRFLLIARLDLHSTVGAGALT